MIPSPRTAPDNWSLVERAQAGDSSAFADIYTANHDKVFRFIHHRLGMDTDTAADLTQDTFVRCLRHIGQVTNQGRDIVSWLFTIARNIVADNQKSGRTRMTVLTGEVWEYDRPAPGSVEDQVADAIERAHIAGVLGVAMADLTDEQLHVLRLRFFDDLDVAATAAAMGVQVGAAKAAQYRAVRALARDEDVRALGGGR